MTRMASCTEIHRAQSALYAVKSDGDTLHAGTADGQLLSWTRTEPERIRLTAQAPSAVYAIAPLGAERLALGTRDGELLEVDLASRQALHRIVAHAGGVHAIEALDNERIASAGADGVLRVWHRTAAAWRLLREIALSDGKLRALSASDDGAMLAVAASDGVVRVLDTNGFSEQLTCPGHEGGAYAVRFHPTKPVLLSGGKDGHLRAWGLSPASPTMPAIAAHRATIYDIAFSPDGRRMATASRDKSAMLWDANSLEHHQRLDAAVKGHRHSVNAVAWLGEELISAGDDHLILRWTGL